MAQWSVLDLDQEQRNFFCLTILIDDVGNKSLREFFKKQWPLVYQKVKGTPPPAPWTNIPNDATEMNNIESCLSLEPIEKSIFDDGDTEKWDFSLLSSVLLHSSLGFVNPSSPEKKALKDLKGVRNVLVGHNTSSKIDDATFKLNWAKTCNALKLFGASQADFTAVEDVLKKPSETLVPILKKIVATEEDTRDSIISKRQLTRLLLKEHFEGQSSRHVLPEDQSVFLQQLLPKFQDDVIASDLLDNLPCLTQEQKDQIAHDEKNFQASKGVRTLVEKLEEHEEGFGQFVQALGKADLGHVAVILDADFEEHNVEDNTKIDKEEAYYSVVGSAVDIMISMSILDDKKKRRLDLEQNIVSSFSNGSSPVSKTLRKDFQKILPKGLYFCHTKQLDSNDHTGEDSNARSANTSNKDSVVAVFRVAKASVLDELWKIYQDKTLDKKLQQVLVSRKSISCDCSLEIVFQKKDYLAIKHVLEAGRAASTLGFGSEDETGQSTESSLPASLEAGTEQLAGPPPPADGAGTGQQTASGFSEIKMKELEKRHLAEDATTNLVPRLVEKLDKLCITESSVDFGIQSHLPIEEEDKGDDSQCWSTGTPQLQKRAGRAASTLGFGSEDETGKPSESSLPASLEAGTGQAAGPPPPADGAGTAQQNLADLFRRKTSVLDGLCLRLDNEYLVIQNWRHLADHLKAPNDVKERCKSSTKHSPTELLLEVPKVSSVSIAELLEKLKDMGRNDVVHKITDKIPEADRNKKISETLMNDYELCDEVALLLDKDSTLKNNWRKLGQKLGVLRDDLKQIGRGSNPANKLFRYAYKTLEPEKLQAGYFRSLIKKFPDRNDVKDFLDTLGVTLQDDRSIKDVFPPESAVLRKLCGLLNLNAGDTVNDWKHLALEWEIGYDTYKSFYDPEKPKPTKILLEDWLVQKHEDFTVEKLCRFLKVMKRNDVREYLENEARG